MSAFKQVVAVTGMNLRSLPARLGSSLVIVVGIAAVVAVLVSVLAMSTGFLESMTRSGRAERAIVLGRNAESESSGGFPRDNAVTILNAPGIKKAADGEPIASAEYLAPILLPEHQGGRDAFIIVRGVGPQAFVLRPEIRLVEGRRFESGLNEMIVGRAAQERLNGITVGSRIAMPNGDWTITGVFESNGDSHESEFLTDANTLIAAMRRGETFNSTTVWLEDPAAYQRFKDSLSTNPDAGGEREDGEGILRGRLEAGGRVLNIVAYVIGGFMALGAVFGALEHDVFRDQRASRGDCHFARDRLWGDSGGRLGVCRGAVARRDGCAGGCGCGVVVLRREHGQHGVCDYSFAADIRAECYACAHHCRRDVRVDHWRARRAFPRYSCRA